MHIYYAVVSFVFGCIFGSFFNVCIYRIPARKSIIRPGSHCYSCGSPIRWYDNIPIVSYLLLRGNCRDCGTHFSPRYLGVELLTGLIFLAIYLKSGAPNAAVFLTKGLMISTTFPKAVVLSIVCVSCCWFNRPTSRR